ncbi:unnamed protein product [Leptidea sinapis]|uniref:Uncharacterized protein n=1 Tax=Leptidea sinapis TaxID=189913 RepID=A0A5E4QHM0_9NEOP|nr:unnamed protein product [Leptidea sinapis]
MFQSPGNNLEIVGLPQTSSESPVDLVLKIAEYAGVVLNRGGIDFAHRVQPQKAIAGRPKPIVAKLADQAVSVQSQVVCKETIIIKASDESKQDILVDALRNFTTANKILKDLIQNYEHLQRIYKSKEEEEDSKKGGKSDTVHNMFKAIFSSGEGEKPRSKKKLQKYDKMRVTQMYLSDIESVEKSVDVESKSDDTSATETSDVIIGAINKIHKETKDSIKKSIENTPAQNKMKKFKKKGKESRDNTVTTVKTRFSIQDDRNKQYTTKHHVGPHFRNNHKSIKRLVYAEIFSPDKMWHEVVNKPVNLQVFNDGGINLRTIKRTNTDNLESEEAEDMVPDDEILMKEQIKGKILRDAYGDACVTVAVQKCYKALKLVSKSVCRFRKCKSGLKNSFMEFSKTGCIREFNSGNGIANSITIAKNIERAIQRMKNARVRITLVTMTGVRVGVTAKVVCKESVIIKASDENKQDILVDVLKNFTTANKILKDLIRNYEHLQRIYKSKEEEEDIKKGLKSDKNMFKAIFSSGEDNKPSSEKILQNDKMRVTQMILSDIGSVEQSTDIESKSDDTSATETSDVEIGASKKNQKENKYSVKNNIKNTPAQNKMKKITKKEKDSRDNNMVTTVKTRFSIQGDRNKIYTTKHHVGPHFRNNHNSIKRLVYAEIFSPDKMWHEVVNKPVNLQVYNDGEINFRTIKRTKTDNLEGEETGEMGSDDEILKTEQITTKILRDAYGEACIKVAVRKCYKALKLVNKYVCHIRRKCKSGLKSSFKEFSKTGCIREFGSADGIANNTVVAKNIGRAKQRTNDMSNYLKVCLPALRYSNEVSFNVIAAFAMNKPMLMLKTRVNVMPSI